MTQASPRVCTKRPVLVVAEDGFAAVAAIHDGYHGGPERQENAQRRAKRLLAQELKRRGWNRKELDQRPKGDRAKVEMAMRLRKETTMTVDCIARELSMGAAGYAANCLRQARRHANVRD